MILMMAAAVTVGSALINGETGIKVLVTDTMQPLLAGSSPYVYAFLCMIALLILTNLINNGVAGAIMVPMSYMFASAIGANAVAITALISVVTNIGILLPCSSAYGAMLSSKQDCFEIKHMYLNCAGFILATILALLIVGIPLSSALM